MIARIADLAIQLILIGLCLTPIVIATRLDPDRRGLGTHEQMGWEPCSWLEAYGRPCPTCGMTTAFASTVKFRLGTAFMANPAGLFLCLLCLAIPLYIVRSWFLGLPPQRFFVGRYGRSWLAWILLTTLLGWIFKLITYQA